MLSTVLKKEKYLHKNIDYLIKLNNLDTKSLAAAVNMPAPTIIRMRQAGHNPTIASLEPLAQFFRISIDTLLYEDISNNEYQSKLLAGSMTYVPVISLEQAVDWKGQQTTNEYKFVGAAGISHSGCYGIEVTNDSLIPVFKNGTTLIIDPKLPVEESDYALCLLNNDQPPVFRQVFKDGKDHFFKPLNPNFGEMKHVVKFKILGVVVKSLENLK